MKIDEDEWMKRVMEGDRAYIEDDGFSDRVVGALPPRRTFDVRGLVLAGSAIGACVLGLVLLPGGKYLASVASRASESLVHQPPLGVAAAGLGIALLLVWALLAGEEA
jgi:hypothetical protein